MTRDEIIGMLLFITPYPEKYLESLTTVELEKLFNERMETHGTFQDQQ